MMRDQGLKAILGAGLMGLMLTGCGWIKHEEPNFTYMPDMNYQPSFKAQEGQMRNPPKGTIPTNFHPYPPAAAYEFDQASKMRNPLPITRAVMERGRHVFNNSCIVCHGPGGEGDGTVESHGYPRPPSLMSEKVRNYTDGRIFNIVSMGQNIMPSYAAQFSQSDRWAVIHYLRALQRAKYPKPGDIKAAERAEQ
jgi:mono/diheme cytochrome c family protein